MPHTIWSGDISFGLVNIPVKLSSALVSTGPVFHRVSPDGTCRLRQRLYCPETETEYDFSETAMGYEIAPHQYVLIEREEIEAIKPESGHVITILNFVKLEQIDPIFFNHTYHLLPDERGEKPYRLLVEAMQAKKMVGISKFIMRRKEYLAALRVLYGKYLALDTMYYEEELQDIRSVAKIPPVSIAKKELDLAVQLIDSFAASFDPSAYKNDYREKLEELIEKKERGQKVPRTHASPRRSGKVIDLMQALKKSVGKKQHPAKKQKTSARRLKKSA